VPSPPTGTSQAEELAQTNAPSAAPLPTRKRLDYLDALKVVIGVPLCFVLAALLSVCLERTQCCRSRRGCLV
jgi:hypothetical protein